MLVRADFFCIIDTIIFRELKKNIDALRQRKQAAENQLQLVLQERRQRTTREGEIEQKIKELRKRKLVIVKKCDDLEVETNQELSSVDHLVSILFHLMRLRHDRIRFAEKRTRLFEKCAVANTV